MYVCVGVYVYAAACLSRWVCIMKTHDRNDLKLSAIVVLNSVSQPANFGSKGASVDVRIRVMVRVGDGVGFRV